MISGSYQRRTEQVFVYNQIRYQVEMTLFETRIGVLLFSLGPRAKPAGHLCGGITCPIENADICTPCKVPWISVHTPETINPFASPLVIPPTP